MQPDLNIVPAPGRQSGLRHSSRLGLSDIYCSFPYILSQNTGRPQLHNSTVKSNFCCGFNHPCGTCLEVRLPSPRVELLPRSRLPAAATPICPPLPLI